MSKYIGKECEECEADLTKENTKLYKRHKEQLCDECAQETYQYDEDEE